MPLFTLHRDFILRTTKGHSVGFEKNKPAWVPPACVPDAVAIGATPVDGTIDVIGEDKPVVMLTPEEREQKIFAAFKTMMERQERTDFGANGMPNAKKVSELVSFEVINRERDDLWRKFSTPTE